MITEIRATEADRERETVLIVKANGERVLQRLGGLDSIPKFQLRAGQHLNIRDTYFDTPERMLLRKQANLRIRQTNGTIFVSAKSASKTDRTGVSSRREVELPWSEDAMASINRRLDLKLSGLSKLESGIDDPRQKLEAMGLQVLQERETRRDTREIIEGQGESSIAELALDKVTYHFGKLKIPIFEIEVEAKSNTKSRTIKKIRNQIESIDRNELLRWKHGKFVTGRAIEKLLQTEKLEDLVDKGGLKTSALKKIDKLISSKEFQKEFE